MGSAIEITELDTRLPFRCFKNDGQTTVSPHWHTAVEILLVTNGIVRLGLEDRLLTVRAGEIVIIDSGATHYFLDSPQSERIVYQFELNAFQHQGDYQTEQELKELFASKEFYSAAWNQGTTAKFSAILLALKKEYTVQQSGFNFALEQHLAALIVTLIREIPVKKSDDDAGQLDHNQKNREKIVKLTKAIQYIEENYAKNICLEQVADYLGYSPDYFSRYFKCLTGMNFIYFLTQYRLNMAKYLLGTEDLQVIQIAEKVGYNSVKTFHHAFKKHVGVSPLQFKGQLQGKPT